MNKPPFMELLETKLRDEERIFKLRSAELNGNNFVISLLVNHDAHDDVLNDALKQKVFEATKEIIPSAFRPIIKYVKANNEESAIVKKIMEYVYKEKPTIYNGFVDAQISMESNYDYILIKIVLEKYLCEYVDNAKLKAELEEYLDKWIMEEVEVEFVEVPNKNELTITKRKQVHTTTIATINIDIQDYVYGNIPTDPRYISDILEATKNNREISDVVLCGTLSAINTRFIQKIEKNLFTFNLNDSTGTIKCKYFAKPFITDPTPADVAIMEKEEEKIKKGKRVNRYNINWAEVFTDGKKLVMSGQIKFDNFDKAYIFMPKSVAVCTIDYSSINTKKDFLPTPENYVCVFPQPMEFTMQDNLFSTQTNPDLLKNDYVVFDVETTGLDPASCEIIELAAIKIVGGKIVESFDTLINPGCSLPDIIVDLTNITDEMLENCFTISDVIGDFFKFTRDTILVAHNAPFDMSFISVAGKKNYYDFNNSYMDTLAMSRQMFPKLKQHKLEAMCKHFDISLVGAHRAINDTLATAQLFIELMNRQNY